MADSFSFEEASKPAAFSFEEAARTEPNVGQVESAVRSFGLEATRAGAAVPFVAAGAPAYIASGLGAMHGRVEEIAHMPYPGFNPVAGLSDALDSGYKWAIDRAEQLFGAANAERREGEEFYGPKPGERFSRTGQIIGALPVQVVTFPLQPAERAQDLIDQGVPVEAAQRAVLADTAFNAATVALPAGVRGPLLRRLGSGAVISTGTSVAGRRVEKAALGEDAPEDVKSAPLVSAEDVPGTVLGAFVGAAHGRPERVPSVAAQETPRAAPQAKDGRKEVTATEFQNVINARFADLKKKVEGERQPSKFDASGNAIALETVPNFHTKPARISQMGIGEPGEAESSVSGAAAAQAGPVASAADPGALESASYELQDEPGKLLGSIDVLTRAEADSSGYEVVHPASAAVIAQGRTAQEAGARAQAEAMRLGRRSLRAKLDAGPPRRRAPGAERTESAYDDFSSQEPAAQSQVPFSRSAEVGRSGNAGGEGIWALPSKLRTGATHVAVRITEAGKRFFYGDSADSARRGADAHDDGIDPGDRAGLLRVHGRAETYPGGVGGVLEGLREKLARDALTVGEARRQQHAGELRAKRGSEGKCFRQSSEWVEQGLGDMLLGIRSQKGETYWHAVVKLPDGTIFDPTANRSFGPGVYEQLGFEPKETLTPQEVRNFIADHGKDFRFPAPHNLGLTGFEDSREAQGSRARFPGTAAHGDEQASSVSTGELTVRVNRMLRGSRARDHVTVLGSEAELPEGVKNRARRLGGESGSGAEGFFDPKTNHIYLFADHISMARAAWVVAHEGAHWGLYNLAESDAAVRSTLQAARSNHVVRTLANAIKADPARMDERLDDHRATGEALAELNAALRTRNWGELKERYRLEVPESLKPKLLDRVNHYVRQLAAALNRMVSLALGRAPTAGEAFSDAQVRDLLYQSWRQMRRGQEREAALPEAPDRLARAFSRIAGGSKSAYQRAAIGLQILARNSDFFLYPISESRDFGQIVLHTDKRMAVEQAERVDPPRASRYDVVRQWNVTMPDGAGARVYETRRGRIFVDVSNLEEGGSGGTALYHAVANYAHNNGKVFVGDPAGLSDTALRRRTENMLNSALKFGTTRHLEPHERQLEGDADLGVEPLEWDDSGTPAADARNLAHLLQRAHQNLLSAHPAAADLRYNFEHGRYEIRRPSGRLEPIGEGAFDQIADTSGRAREARAGRLTYKRAAVINALLRGAGSAEWRGFLQKLSQQSSEVERLDLPLHGIGYSRNRTPPNAGFFVDGADAAVRARRIAPGESASWAESAAAREAGKARAAQPIPGVDARHDVPLAGGKSTTVDPATGGKTTYIDKDMPRHVWVPEHEYKGKNTPGQWVDTHAEIHAHEEGEEPQLDAQGYEAAHDGAGNDATRRYLAERGVDPRVYQNVIRPHLDAIREKAEQNRATDIPADLDRRPYDDSGQGHLLRQDQKIARDPRRGDADTATGGPSGSRPDFGAAVFTAGAGEPVGRFAELPGAHLSPRQAYEDAAALTGLHLDIDVVHGAEDMPADVPMRYSLGARRIEINPHYVMDRGKAAQFMAEELLHAVDHLGGRRTISAGSRRLAPDGDIGREAIAHFQSGGRYSAFLGYPLNEQISDGRMRAELFARLGTLYFADPAGVKLLLPAVHGAFDEQFRLAGYEHDTAGTIQGKVWTGTGGLFQESRGQREVRAIFRGSEASFEQQSANRLGRVSQGTVRGFRLGDLRNSFSRSFGSPLGGGRVRLDDLEAKSAPPQAGRIVSGGDDEASPMGESHSEGGAGDHGAASQEGAGPKPAWPLPTPNAGPAGRDASVAEARAPEPGAQSFRGEPGKLLGSVEVLTREKADASGYEVVHPASGKVITHGRTAQEAKAGAQGEAARLGRRRLQAKLDAEPLPVQRELRYENQGSHPGPGAVPNGKGRGASGAWQGEELPPGPGGPPPDKASAKQTNAPPSEGRIVSRDGADAARQVGTTAASDGGRALKTVELKTREEFRSASFGPQPNTIYKYDGFSYATDEHGRGINSSGMLRDDPGHRFRDDRKIGRRGKKGDIGFHAGADRFGFQGGPLNVSPGNAKLNGRKYKAFEDGLARLVADPKNKVYAEFRRVFRQGNVSTRPDAYEVHYRVNDGPLVFAAFENETRE